MRQIRGNVFETNSSSTHSLTMCSAENYNKWENGETLFKYDKFYTREDAIKELKKNRWFIKDNPDFDWEDIYSVNEALKSHGYETNKEYANTDSEFFWESFITKSGEEIFAFGRYGYND